MFLQTNITQHRHACLRARMEKLCSHKRVFKEITTQTFTKTSRYNSSCLNSYKKKTHYMVIEETICQRKFLELRKLSCKFIKNIKIHNKYEKHFLYSHIFYEMITYVSRVA